MWTGISTSRNHTRFNINLKIFSRKICVIEQHKIELVLYQILGIKFVWITKENTVSPGTLIIMYTRQTMSKRVRLAQQVNASQEGVMVLVDVNTHHYNKEHQPWTL